MDKVYRKGAVGALLDEYEKAIGELKELIKKIPDEELPVIVDAATADENCRSVQTILTHVVYAAYGYATYLRNRKGGTAECPPKATQSTVAAYIQDLDTVFQFTVTIMEEMTEAEMEDTRKVFTGWGERYTTEQLVEHAIVHILRHRRQLEKFQVALQKR
ncbi:DinB family protein [Chitinophaga solisilvae]|uniref:DinB family protein n=1 Tax=Chitinophaga solisilvae TaxID=1233460 RepID=A0A3S1BJ98_9BACT|nr:DinB family protein [Chitinophaga solisilvae]NSL86122.1 DinB family protein [Chitinophaga solisilvae]